MIDKHTLLLVRVLAAVGYSGLLIWLPRRYAQAVLELVDLVTEEIVGVTLQSWATDAVDTVHSALTA